VDMLMPPLIPDQLCWAEKNRIGFARFAKGIERSRLSVK
jgi:hypothetical protein